MRRFFERIEQKGLTVNRFRADCGSCSEEIVEEVGKHCKTFYIRANRSSSLYDDIFALRGWKKEEFNGIEFELAKRKAAWVKPEPKIKTGYLSRYAKLTTSASRGAVVTAD